MDIDLAGVSKRYDLSGDVSIPALGKVDLRLTTGDFVALVGPSGCGKTTLLSVIGLLCRPSGGRYLLDGRDVERASRSEQAQWRADDMGFIFQSYNLLPRENAWRNVMLPLSFRRVHRARRRERALEVLEAVGLSRRARHYPSQMSGGEQQRVAIARALVNNPRLLLADEPTGNLDSATGREIMTLITEMARRFGSTVIMATHDQAIAGYAGRVVSMKDGRVVDDTRRG